MALWGGRFEKDTDQADEGVFVVDRYRLPPMGGGYSGLHRPCSDVGSSEDFVCRGWREHRKGPG